MTVISVAEACRRLGIDAKTLHRWLHEAQLPLHPPPGDGRTKEVSQEHLEHLTRLPASPQPPSALVPGDVLPLPAPLLALPETIAALQAQIAALQQEVTELSRVLQQSHPPARTLTPHHRPAHHPPRPPSDVPRPRPVTTVPLKPIHVIPRVEYGQDGHSVVICPKKGRLPFEPDTPEWFARVSRHHFFCASRLRDSSMLSL
jgi:transposase-like protein